MGKLSYNDGKNYIMNTLTNNKSLIYILGNAFFISIIITICIILIWHFISDTYIFKGIYSLLLTLVIILANNYIIKLKYKKDSSNDSSIFSNTNIAPNQNRIAPRRFNGKGGANEYMSNNIIEKKDNQNIESTSEDALEPDIQKFLGMSDK